MVAAYQSVLFAPRPDWFDEAACKGMDVNIFFPEPAHMGGTDPLASRAKSVCARCPVSNECLEFALTPANERFGVWGGLGEKARRMEARQRRRRRALGLDRVPA